jgi:hypothetical protein
VKLGALYGVGHQIILLVMINYFTYCCNICSGVIQFSSAATFVSALLFCVGTTYCHLTASRYFQFHGQDVCMNHLRACSLFAFFCAITSFLSHGCTKYCLFHHANSESEIVAPLSFLNTAVKKSLFAWSYC